MVSTPAKSLAKSCIVVVYSETVMMTMTMTTEALIGKMDHWKSR